ncbi:MAG: hypothetical protein KOO63_07715 [Bacteroidales bacterium]|nr:hypothetical protein [Candidatus Latescibacterota bacterium]
MIGKDKTKINRTILYYPTIALPEGSWLKQALLYWDELASIVPLKYDYETDKTKPVIPYSPDIEYLFDKNVFRPIPPDNFLKLENHFEKHDEFFEEIKIIVKSESFKKLVPKNKKRFYNSKIHHDKVSNRLFDWLQRNGLAKKWEGEGEWYRFENNTGLLYMALLAKYLADIDINHTMPGTNLNIYEGLVFKSPSLNEGFSCLDVKFKNSLPIPREDVSIADILDFKENNKNRMALLNFRSSLDQFHRDLSDSENKNIVNQVLAGFKENIELGVSELTELMKESGIETATGCLKTIVNVKSPTLWGTAGLVADQATKIADLPLEWTIPGLTLVGAIEVGHYLVSEFNKKRAALRGSEFSYLYHAQEWGII